jgi:hypothetical protein
MGELIAEVGLLVLGKFLKVLAEEVQAQVRAGCAHFDAKLSSAPSPENPIGSKS